MAKTNLLLNLLLLLLALSSALELAFISTTVSYLHTRAGRSFLLTNTTTTTTSPPNDTIIHLHGKPLHLLVNQGHTSNGAAGTALILISLLGLLTLYLRHKNKTLRVVYYAWLLLTLLSPLLSLTALIYTSTLTSSHSSQVIDLTLAATLNNTPYPQETWTPETWFTAVLELPLAHSSDVENIRLHLKIMRGWRWNLIPMFILGMGVCVLALLEARSWRKKEREGKKVEA